MFLTEFPFLTIIGTGKALVPLEQVQLPIQVIATYYSNYYIPTYIYTTLHLLRFN